MQRPRKRDCLRYDFASHKLSHTIRTSGRVFVLRDGSFDTRREQGYARKGGLWPESLQILT
jgi:hypothetical protein